MSSNVNDDISGSVLGDRPARGIFHQYSQLMINGASSDVDNDFNQHDPVADIFSLLRIDALLKPEFYSDDRNATQAIADIKYLLGRAATDFAALRNNSTTDPTAIGELRDHLEEDIGKIQKLFETLSQAARFQGTDRQDIRSLPTEALTRSNIGNGVLSTDIQRVTSRLAEASKLVHKAASVKLTPRPRPR